MRFLFIAAEKANYPVEVLCRCLEVSTSGFYAFQSRPRSRRDDESEGLAREINAVHTRSKARYGSPRIMHQLRRKGLRVGRKRVARLMRQQGLFGRTRRRFKATTDSRHDEPIAPNLLQRNFTAEAPGVAMVGDTTAIATQEGWLFLAVLVDLCTRAIVGWALGDNNDTVLITKAFRMAIAKGYKRGFIHHTDRG